MSSVASDSSLEPLEPSQLGGRDLPLAVPPVRTGEHGLPVFQLDSQEPLPEQAGGAVQRRSPADFGPQAGDDALQMWLDGQALMCVCPSCGVPLSVRIWLMLADCWRCDTGILLSEQEQRRAEQMMAAARTAANSSEANSSQANAASAAAPVRPQPRPAPSEPNSSPGRDAASRPRGAESGPTAPPPLPTVRPARPDHSAPSPSRPHRKKRRLGLGDWLRQTPAWFVSMVFHVVLFTLLALITFEDEKVEPKILLSTTVDRRQEGGDIRDSDPLNEVHFDLPIPDEQMQDEKVRREVILADQDAKELRLDPDAAAPNLMEMKELKRQLAVKDAPAKLLARDPRIRAVMVQREGGTTRSEAAVARALRWIAARQNPNGSWSLHRFGGVRSDTAGTALALLPLLGAGQTHEQGIYQSQVAGGLRWLVEIQNSETGDLRNGDTRSNNGMYAHGQATLALCDAYAMTGDARLREPAQKAINFIVEAQNIDGGWGYRPGNRSDTSISIWQLQALHSARIGQLDVPETAFDLADNFLDKVALNEGAQYGYTTQDRRTTPALTAAGLLSRMYLGRRLDDLGLRQGIEFLAEEHPPRAPKGDHNVYYWYYGIQVMHNAGGDAWKRYNVRMRDLLVKTQVQGGPDAGSWKPEGAFSNSGGRLYETALRACVLEVYYRHAPIYRQIKLD